MNDRIRQVATLLSLGAELMEQQLRQREIIARTVNGAREMLAKLIAETNSTDSAYAAEWRERATFWRDQGDRAQMRKCAQEMRWHMQHSR